jgi:ferritin
MKQFKLRVTQEILTLETIELTDEQIVQYKQWLMEHQGHDEEEVQNLEDVGASYLYDWTGEVDIPTTITRTYKHCEVEYNNIK